MEKIKKLTISAEKGGFTKAEPKEILKQSITIKSNGQIVWTALRTLSTKEISKGFNCELVKISERKNVGKANAEKILKRANEVLINKIDCDFKVLICDATPDKILIEYENGKIVSGQLIDLTYNLDDVELFYDFLAKETLINNLLFFKLW